MVLRRVSSRLMLTFFGLTREHRLQTYTNIHEIVYYGGGGYTWDDVFNMPLWLIRFVYKKIVEAKEKEQEKTTSSTTKSKGKSKTQALDLNNLPKKKNNQVPLSTPSHPDYTTKASKQ